MTTSSQLKSLHLEAQPDSKYFDRDTMKFFGDTMSNFAVSKDVVETNDGDRIAVYELRRKAKTHKGAPAGIVAFFDMNGFRRHDIKKDRF
ncbi:hypothetical protein QJS83_14975 [Bdellovibrio sp. 22V]|uniref:hypothetical protein n=1 Tax=Bdellovibrio sp. 22V TaxID=3044166 RepID=UPI002542778A|nr:hypothetical protein [Bdellovibrio sp. 22V]WII71766.1 hypothetical protein QJS83_14975 [Bdellovibrio sp. 22V]